MESHVSSTHAARNFSDIVNRVLYRREEFIVERGGEAVCRIVPATPAAPGTLRDLARLFENGPRLDPEFWDHVEEAVRQANEPPEDRWSS